MIRILSVAVAVAALAACTASREVPADTLATPAAAAAGERVGTVRIVGSAPVNIQVVLQTEDGTLQLVGPMLDELRRLSGAEVAVAGEVEGRTLTATDYTVRAVNGRPVTVGVVESIANGYVQLRTEAGEIVYLASAPDTFRRGQKVWVQGPASVIVQSYGTIQP